MKKVSILIALALLVTVGGVYATWNYATGNVEPQNAGKTVQLSPLGAASEKGVINVAFSPDATIFIDDTNSDYKAELAAAGTVTATFTPGVGVTPEISNGVKVQYKVTWTGANTFKDDTNADVQIFTNTTYTSTDIELLPPEYKAVWNVQDLVGHLGLKDFSLDNITEYNNCASVLSHGTFTVEVSFISE